MTQPPLIPYGHAPAIRRSTVRRLIIATIVVSVVVTIQRYREWIQTEIWFLYQEHRWKNCEIDAYQVVFDSTKTAPVTITYSSAQSHLRVLGYVPEARKTLYNYSTQYYAGTSFIHRRISKSGRACIVNVDIHCVYFIYPDVVHRMIFLQSFVDDVRYQPPAIGTGNVRSSYIKLGEMDHLRFFGGQPDPVDPSHFTIAYDYDGRAGVIDGYLQDDATVRFSVNGKDISDANPSGGWTPQ